MNLLSLLKVVSYLDKMNERLFKGAIHSQAKL